MAFADTIGPRTIPAWRAINDLLADGQWHTHDELVQAATNHSDLAPKSIDNLIRRGWRARHYTRTKAGAPHVAQAIYRLKERSR